MSGEHLLHESTAWLLALGLAMIAAGFWPVAAIGVAAIVGGYSVALVGYEVVDVFEGEETAARIASHLPLLLGLVFALLVARERVGARRPRASDVADDEAPAAPAASGAGRRRGHLWPINRSVLGPIARSTTSGRRMTEPADLRWMSMTASSDDEAVTALALAAARRKRAGARGIHQSHSARCLAVCHLSVRRGQRGRSDSGDLPAGNRRHRAVLRALQRAHLAAGDRASCGRRSHPTRPIAPPQRAGRRSRAAARRPTPRPRVRRPG